MYFRNKQIPRPRHWQEFEELCLALFREVWKDELAQKNGRTGRSIPDTWFTPYSGDMVNTVSGTTKSLASGLASTLRRPRRWPNAPVVLVIQALCVGFSQAFNTHATE
jgi:hypothetical protein